MATAPVTGWTYGLPALPLAMLGIPFYVLVPGLYAEKAGIGLLAVGLALFVARLWDLVTDPLVGALTDHLSSRRNARKWLMAAGAPLLVVATFQLLSPPTPVDVGYLVGWSMACFLGWTLISVPHLAWSADLSFDYHERSRLNGWREGMAVAGILVAGLIPLAMGMGDDPTAIAHRFAWVMAILIPAGLAVTLLTVPDPRVPQPATRPHWRMALPWQNRPLRRLLLAYSLNGVANGIPAALFILFVGHVLLADAWLGLFLAAYFSAAVLVLPGWIRLSRSIGRQRTWPLAMLWAAASFAWVPLLGAGDSLAFLLICLLSGAALGAEMALPAAIQADVVDQEQDRGGVRRPGYFFGLWGLATKLSGALAVALAFGLLSLAPDAGADDYHPLAIALLYGALPIPFKLAAAVLVWRFPLERATASDLHSNPGDPTHDIHDPSPAFPHAVHDHHRGVHPNEH